MVDVIYIAASARDARFTRICVASVRCFYPDIPVRLLISGRLQRGLADELQHYCGVSVAAVPEGDYGFGFVKLEPLFGPAGERFLVLDSDTALTGPVLRVWTDKGAQFLVDDEQQSDADTRRLYYDWEKVREIDSTARAPHFVFNSGQWFGTAGVLTRADFATWVDWTMPRKLRYRDHFRLGDQGVLNYVLNRKSARGELRVERQKILRWPAHGMQGLDAAAVSERSCPSLVVHWAGLKKTRQRDMVGADLLAYFEKQYYRRLPAGGPRRILAGCEHALTEWFQVRVRLGFRALIRRYQNASQWA